MTKRSERINPPKDDEAQRPEMTFDYQMQIAREIMKEDSDVLLALSKL